MLARLLEPSLSVGSVASLQSGRGESRKRKHEVAEGLGSLAEGLDDALGDLEAALEDIGGGGEVALLESDIAELGERDR